MVMADDEASPTASTPTWVDRMRMVPLSESDAPSGEASGTTPARGGDVDGADLPPLEFSVASLNVLAESYLTPRSHPGLPESHAAVAFDPSKRQRLLIDTLERFCRPNASDDDDGNGNGRRWDVLALQELDLCRDGDPVLPAFERWGYGIVRTSTSDGGRKRDCCCAVAYDRSKFKLVRDETVEFDDLATLRGVVDAVSAAERDATTEGAMSGPYKKRGPNKSKNPPSGLSGIVRTFLRRNCAVLVHLESIDTRESFIVTSAHLYWNPGYEYVKLCQSKYLLDRVAAFASRGAREVNNPTTPSSAGTSEKDGGTRGRIPTIICGDMNSKPGSAVHKLFVQPHVDARAVAPWHYFWDQEGEENYTEDGNAENHIGEVSLSDGDRKDGQDQIVAGSSNLPVVGVGSAKQEVGTKDAGKDLGEDSQTGGARKIGQDPIVTERSGVPMAGQGGVEKRGETGYVMSGLPSEFTMYCSTIEFDKETNNDEKKGGEITSEIAAVNPGDDSKGKCTSHAVNDAQIKSDNTALGNPPKQKGSPEREKPKQHPVLSSSSVSEVNCDNIDNNCNNLKASVSTVESSNATNGKGKKDSEIADEIAINPVEVNKKTVISHEVNGVHIESEIAAVNDSQRGNSSSSVSKANGEDISSNYDELKTSFLTSRPKGHITPQDYQHSTPPPPVKYMLDYTLNRFTRWLRILGIDAVLETIEQEHERTHGGKIAMFDRCKKEHRTLITSSYKLLLRKECPPGAYLLDSKSTSDLLEQTLPALLCAHGVELSPRTFLTRCVMCNGHIHRIITDEEKKRVFVDHGAPDLVGRTDMEVFRCDGCGQGYWWDDRPSSSASRVFAQATKLLRTCLRGGVGLKGEGSLSDEKQRKEVMGAFDFVNVEEERRIGDSTARERQPEPLVMEWLREEKLSNPFRLRSAYAAQRVGAVGEQLPFTNVTKEFVGCLDYTFFEPSQFDQVGRLNVPTSFRHLNASGVGSRHLLPSDIWPSDHIAVGGRFRLKRRGGKDRPEVPRSTEAIEKPNQTNGTMEDDDTAKLPPPHGINCACGCNPKSLSVFEIAEVRKKAREKKKAEAAAIRSSYLSGQTIWA